MILAFPEQLFWSWKQVSPYIQPEIDQNVLQKGMGVLLSLSIIFIYHKRIYNSEQSYELLHTVCFFLFN